MKSMEKPETVHENEMWMEKAEKEVRTAKVNLDNEEYEAAAFFSHQAAEKALKALYIKKFRRLWKVHDLFELGKKVNAPKNMLNLCEKLNPHYIATRYPADVKYTKEKAEEALNISEKVVKWAKKALE